MKRSVFVLAGAAAIVAGSILAAQQPGAKPPAAPMGFFVTSVGMDGGNLGGLQGADAHCQKLAAASGQAGRRRQGLARILEHAGTERRQRARSHRSGAVGQCTRRHRRARRRAPAWRHVDVAQLGSNLTKTTALTEKNTPVLGAGDMGPEGKPLNQHDILTGSTTAGTRVPGGRRSHL